MSPRAKLQASCISPPCGDIFDGMTFQQLLRGLQSEHEKLLAKAEAEIQMLQAQNVILLRESSSVTIGSQQHPPVLADAVDAFIVEEHGLGITPTAESNWNSKERPSEVANDEQQFQKAASHRHTRTINDLIVERPTVEARATRIAAHAGDVDVTSAAPTAILPSRLQSVRSYLESTRFDLIVSLVLLANTIFMGVELQCEGLRTGFRISFYEEQLIAFDDWSVVDSWLRAIDIVFISIFAADVGIRILFLGRAFWMSFLNWLDALVVAASFIFLFVSEDDLPVSPVLLRFVRCLKLSRAFRMLALASNLESLSLLIKCLFSSMSILGWATLLVVFLLAISGMVVSNLVQDYFLSLDDEETRQHVFSYWGTFFRAFLTMFEVLFANWAPPCRVLVDNVSEWFGILFIVMRCSLGFALLNVMGSVFISQTLKNAGDDEQILLKQQAVEIARTRRKMEQVFRAADSSGDGVVSMEEFKNMLKDERIRLWLKQLQLEHHDLVELFELIDDGDGLVSWPEFLHGAMRIKGIAKSSDLFRLETKLDTVLRATVSKLRSPS